MYRKASNRRARYKGNVFAALLVLTVSPKTDLLDFCMAEWMRTPRMEMQDAYKFLYQATLGGEHAISDDTGPRAWMDREWTGLGPPHKGEPEVQKLTPDGGVIRINLRPYRARGGDKEMLLAVFVASARKFRADKSDFVREWNALGSLLKRRHESNLTFREWQALDKKLRAKDFPALHHSERYEHAYKPAYRVALGEMWLQGR